MKTNNMLLYRQYNIISFLSKCTVLQSITEPLKGPWTPKLTYTFYPFS